MSNDAFLAKGHSKTYQLVPLSRYVKTSLKLFNRNQLEFYALEGVRLKLFVTVVIAQPFFL